MKHRILIFGRRSLIDFFTGVFSLFMAVCVAASVSAQKLVPEESARSPNYCCTWYAQNYWIKRGQNMPKLEGISDQAAREELNEHAIFNNKEGWATNYLPRGRQDFTFLIDHGWQTKEKSKRVAGGPDFFNLVAEESDFPRYEGMEPQ